MEQTKFDQWVQSVSHDVGRPWPFLVKRVWRRSDIHISDSGWKFAQTDRWDDSGAQATCDGYVSDVARQMNLTFVWTPSTNRIASVAVEGVIHPGRVVEFHQVAIFSRDNDSEANQIVAHPFHGLLEFLKGESLSDKEYVLWEVITTTARPTAWQRNLLSSFPRETNSDTCPSPEPAAASSPAST